MRDIDLGYGRGRPEPDPNGWHNPGRREDGEDEGAGNDGPAKPEPAHRGHFLTRTKKGGK